MLEDVIERIENYYIKDLIIKLSLLIKNELISLILLFHTLGKSSSKDDRLDVEDKYGRITFS